MDHFIRVLNAKEKLGILQRHETELKNHPLIGKKVICLDSEKEYYTVDKVYKQWHLGYYIALALVDNNRSHRIVYFENINCHEKLILDDIEDNKKIVQFIS